MSKGNWIEILNERFIAHGISLSTEESILKNHKKEFNSVLRDLKQTYPNKKLWHMLLSMHNHYDIKFIAEEMLDAENRLDVRMELVNEHGRILTKEKRRK